MSLKSSRDSSGHARTKVVVVAVAVEVLVVVVAVAVEVMEADLAAGLGGCLAG